MPSNNDASLRQKVEQIARAPLESIDSVIRTLDPAHDNPGVMQSRQVESALAAIVGDSQDAPISNDPRDAAARRIQGAWRRSRKPSRSRVILGQILAQLVAMEIVGHGGGKRLFTSHTEERDRHLKALGTMLDILAAHGKSTQAGDLAAMIESVLNLDYAARKKLLPKATSTQIDAMHRGLVYLSNSARASYRIVFEGGLLMWRGQPFDTAKMKSYWSPQGRAIYVVDSQGQFYAAEQKLPDDAFDNSRFHHSSFLSGAPVFGAGEMQVAAGKLEVLTAQSGHYRPTHKEMVQTVRRLAENGIRFYRIALWAKDQRMARELRQKFPKAQLYDEDDTGPGSYRMSTDPEQDGLPLELMRATVDGKELAIYVPAHEYLFNPSLQKLSLFDPTRAELNEDS